MCYYVLHLLQLLNPWKFAGPSFTTPDGLSYVHLPPTTIFPGPWETNIKAPANKHHIRPRSYNAEGSVSRPESLIGANAESKPTVIGRDGLIVFEFAENIAGRACLDIGEVSNGHVCLALAYSESSRFTGKYPDATTDRQDRDLPLYLPIDRVGTTCVGPDFVRGAFKYLTIYLAEGDCQKEGFGIDESLEPTFPADSRPFKDSQAFIGGGVADSHVYVSISEVWVNCAAFPSNPNPRAYTGYFDSSSSLLNRIWYAGAYTLQLTAVDPKEGSALIDYNRKVDRNISPQGSWYSNFTISNGTSVTTDGAKRDRMVWPGDMSIAVPGIAVSTYDMLSVRNALDTLFDHQYSDGSLPYAGPPMGYNGEFSDTYHLHTLIGTWNYILYTNDLDWLRKRWPAYLRALEFSLAKVDSTGLLHVTSAADWLRPGMTGHNLEASCILFDVIDKSIRLASFLNRASGAAAERWQKVAKRLQSGISLLYCPHSGLYADNLGRRGCGGPEEVLPQDGNSWALLSGIVTSSRARNVSQSLQKRWTRYGAPAPEFPNVISPFASSFELMGHCRAGSLVTAVELMELMWGYMLDGPGFTNSTFVEGYRLDGDIQYPAYPSAARNSHAHGWSTGPTAVLLTQILGIELLTPLGREWRVTLPLELARKFGPRGHIRGGFATELGKFEVTLKMYMNEEGRPKYSGTVDTPPHTRGSVEMGPHLVHDIEGGYRCWQRQNLSI